MYQDRSSKDERDLRSLKKRLDKYNSAKEAIFDPFFSDLIVARPLWKENDQKESRWSFYLRKSKQVLSCTVLATTLDIVYVLNQQIQTYLTKFYFAKMWCNVMFLVVKI